MTKKLLLTVPEAAEALGISRAFLYEILRRGEIPVVKLGRASRIPVGALENWVNAQIPTGGEFDV